MCSLLALYPNLEDLGEYMGLSLNSDEVQRNMALLPMADNVSVVGSFNPPSTTRESPPLVGVCQMVCLCEGCQW